MNENEFKVLQKMMKEVVSEEVKPVIQRLDKVEQRFDKVEQRLDKVERDIREMKEDIGIIKEDLEEVRGTTDLLSEWAEAVTEYKFPDLHYPLHDNEKLTTGN